MSVIKKDLIKILIIDDDEDDFLITKQYIDHIQEQEFIIDPCFKYSEAEQKICEGKYDLYFVDYRLGAKTGLELIQESIAKNCEEPFILLTGNGNHKLDLMAMESGAVDYLVKGELSSEKLERCIRYSLERANSIKELRAKETKFRHIFERSKDTVFIADEKLYFTEVNNASFTLLGYEREELLAKSLTTLIANKKDITAIEEQLADTGDVSDREMELLTKNGEKKYCLVTLSKEKDMTGAKYIQGIIHDITELKKAERVTLLLEKQNVTGRLVRMMAHELRNPLNNIMLSAEQLNELAANPDTQVCLDIINRNSKRIGDLITELLNSSRRDPVTVEKRTLQEILEETLEAAIDRINLRQIRLKRNFLPEPAWIMADNEKLKIAFLNIIINAIEAMPEKEGELNISLWQKDKQYVVSIEDNGCGISDEDLSKVFEPYFTSKQNGMGLGLASTFNILQSHKASYDVRSKLNQGTVFHLFFHTA
ncbi:MAG TPA: ATP-binding protein [Ferruginibacter sp.]|nr:ATP-binding protein [Ferruginibacter sp.]